MEEIWKDIEGYEGLYRVSNLGRVLSVRFGPKTNSVPIKPAPRIMRQSRSSSGYLHVQLYKDGESSTKLVHILVARTFIPNPENKREVNHLDGDKSNNCVDNLEWSTRSENQRHAIKMGLRLASPGIGRLGAKNPLSKSVFQFSLNGKFIRRWDSSYEAAMECGFNRDGIRHCAAGRCKTSQGYVWRYAE